ncbi:MAG: DUF2953 domain-containing protein [Lachnospiraceae bacterium]|nr:DUF2953 domain-containing protein [Lachnospiraceae bacterium]
MSVLLTVLKIIGIILLSLLALILLILVIVLFAPIGYDADGIYDDENKPLINVHAHWLLRIIRFRFTLNGKEQEKELRILFFKVYPKKEKEEQEDREENPKDPVKEEPPETVSKEHESAEKAFERAEEKISSDDTCVPDEYEASESSDEEKPEKKRVSVFKKVSDAYNKIKYKIRDICDKIRDGRTKAEDMIEKLSDDRTKNAIIELWEVLKRLLWHIRPRRFRLYLHYGMDDPSLTGQIYGVYTSFYPIHMGKPVIVPDFDNKCLEGNFLIKGHVQLFFVLTALIRLYFNKDVKRLYAMIKK